MMKRINYAEAMKELRSGSPISQIAKKRKINYKNLRTELKKRYKNEYIKLVFGEIIDTYKGHSLKRLPEYWGNNECNITKKAKKIFIDEGYVPEVSVRSDKTNNLLAVIDLYSPKHKMGLELIWQSKESTTQLINKIKRYEKYFPNVVCVLLKDSKSKKSNRTYNYTVDILQKALCKVMVLDLAYPLREAVSFPLELEKRELWHIK